MPVEEMLKKIEFDKLGVRPKSLPYSFYELFYHIYFTQKDILDYCTNPDYLTADWPADYWPKIRTPISQTDWKNLQEDYLVHRQQLEELIIKSENKLLDAVPSVEKHSLFREFLLVIEHTAYHSGQLLIILRHLGYIPLKD